MNTLDRQTRMFIAAPWGSWLRHWPQMGHQLIARYPVAHQIIALTTAPFDAGREDVSARQRPLHGERIAGIAAAGDDAEVTARLRERVRIDVGLGRGRLDNHSRAWRRERARP